MIAELPQWIADATQLIGFFIAFAAACGLFNRYLIKPSLTKIIQEETSGLKTDVIDLKKVIDKELSPNGGTSMRDKIIRMEADVRVLKEVHEIENKP